MALVQALLAMVTRSAGKLLNTVFGWATQMLFGKVAEDRQIYLSIMAFGSVTWLIAVLGIIFPNFGALLLTFVKPPAWVNDNWIRLAMFGLAIVIPLIVGMVSLKVVEPQEQPKGGAKVKAVLRGYPFTLGLASTLLLLTLFAPILKIRTMMRRWASQHVPMIVESDEYMEVVADVERALASDGWKMERRPAPWMMTLPTKILVALAGGGVDRFVADNLTTLHCDTLEVVLHPSDMVISGKEADVAHARATVAEQLAFSRASLTWSKDANEMEERLEALWRDMKDFPRDRLQREVPRALQQIEKDLKQTKIPYEEWEVLERQKLLVERGFLRALAGITDEPVDPTHPAHDRQRTAQPELARARERATAAPGGVVSGIAAMAAFAIAQWWQARSRRRAPS